MNRKIFIALILALALFPAVNFAATPSITMGLQSGSLREMDNTSISMGATDSAGHALAYDWSITNDGTGGKAYVTGFGQTAEVGVFWAGAPGGSLNNSSFTVQVLVRHANPADDEVGGVNSATTSATFTVNGVNHPPDATIAGNLGTSTNRIASGRQVCASANISDPDGTSPRSLWSFGPWTGGRWVTGAGNNPPTLFGSEGGEACFTVLDMSANIDQQISLKLEDGLHTVIRTATIYLKPSATPPPTTNRAPTVSFPTNPVQVAVGGTAQLVADAEDLDGDACDYSFVFIQTNATVNSSVITVQTVSTTKKRVTATLANSPAGTFDFRFTARERSTTDHKIGTGIITLQVGSSPPPTNNPNYTDTPGPCDSATGAPSVTITPNVQTSKPVFQSGSVATITAVAFDTTEQPSSLDPTKTQKGAIVTWDFSDFTAALGITPNVVSTPRSSDPRYTDSTVTFTVPTVSAAKDVFLSIAAQDVLGCSHTIRFAIQVAPSSTSNNQPPVAKIQYKVGSSAYTNAPATAVQVETGSAVTVTLKGDTSTDDGGASNLTYSWAKTTDSITAGGVTFGSAAGATTTLQITAHTKGTYAVTLTAKDQANLTGTATISFNIIDPAQKPIARATAKVGTQALTGSVDEGTVVKLDGSASSRSGSTTDKTGLTYQWTQTEGPNVTLTDADKAVASFTAPAATDTATRLKFKLIVSDSTIQSDPLELTINLSQPSFYFSQVAVGPLGTSQFRTVLLLVNRNEAPATGVEVSFFGDDGKPMAVTINNQPWDGEPFDIPALGSKKLEFTGQDLKSGWAKVNSGVKIVGLLQYQIVGEDETLETEVGLYATEGATKFATFYDLAAETAIAVANTSAQPATVRIRLIDEKNGNEVVSKNLFVLKPGGLLPALNHDAKFLTKEFLGELPPDFALGTLLIESNVPVSITVLKTRGGVVFSTLPVASMR